ncbi:hypothetical protein R8871_06614 [Paraburkholderia graminis C4D1M]|jgi:hypothetical protein|uniref:Uncharacterized protein n=1 Tax=Paraburkholderia graminis (strain ATCC 700544 / DSM 17151 / LMG 18924 / NCIMB 13744 / C4D1M) TaxID=396598 RepID=B1GAW4_PARG4|nr:hypothetical protein BgramDRAFT_6501 [Paraburkholderia graminis C4D1M]CAB3740603.1 hypothetical protein R8871_06614 [Paraburkholderia graminis C4D1M]
MDTDGATLWIALAVPAIGFLHLAAATRNSRLPEET